MEKLNTSFDEVKNNNKISDNLIYAGDIPRKKKVIRLKSGMEAVDKVLCGIVMTQMTIITGYSGEGKTTFINQMIGSMLEQDHKVWFMSGESQNVDTRDKILKQLAREEDLEIEILEEYNQTDIVVKEETFHKINNWLSDKLIIQREMRHSVDDIISSMQMAIARDGVKIFVLDNLMMIETAYNTGSKLAEQIKTVNKINEFIVKNGVHLFLIAHPRKPSSGQKKDILSKYSVSGASEIVNLASNVLTIERLKPKERGGDGRYETLFEKTGVYCSTVVTNHKSRLGAYGRSCSLNFDTERELFYNPYTKNELHRIRAWEQQDLF